MQKENYKLNAGALNGKNTLFYKLTALALAVVLIVTMSLTGLLINYVYAAEDESTQTDVSDNTDVNEESEPILPTIDDVEKLKTCVMILIAIVAVACFVTKAMKLCVIAVIIFVILSFVNGPVDDGMFAGIKDFFNNIIQTISQEGFFSNMVNKIVEFVNGILG